MQSAYGSGEGQSSKRHNKPFKQRKSASGTIACYPIRLFPDDPLAFDLVFLMIWTWSVCSTPAGFTGLLLLLSGLGLCLLFLTRAVVEAQTNWQIRTGRMGTLREFLATDEAWMPS